MGYYEDIITVCRRAGQRDLSRAEVWGLLREHNKTKYAGKKTSVNPGDYCFNCVNHGICFDKYIFIRVDQDRYEFVDEGYPYEGSIFYAPEHWGKKREVGKWKNGEFCFWEIFRKVPREYYRSSIQFEPNNGISREDGEVIDEVTYREILTRRGQTEFRKKLLVAYGNRCPVTGCNVLAALEAAHIIPHAKRQKYEVRGGILLRADIHTLFDVYLMSIEPESRKLMIAEECAKHYIQYRGIEIAEPSERACRPAKRFLSAHYEKWLQKNNG